MGYTPIVSYESTRVKSKLLKNNKKGPESKLGAQYVT